MHSFLTSPALNQLSVMTISPEHLLIDSTTHHGMLDGHLLTVQAAMINQIAHVTRRTLVLDDLLHSIALQLHDTLQVSGCLIFQADDAQQMAASDARLRSNLCSDFYQYYHSWLAQGKLVIMPGTEQRLPPTIQESARECGLSSLLIVPLWHRQSYLGGVTLYQCEKQREWTPQEIAFVQAIADHCAIALHQVELEQRCQTELKQRQQAQSALQASEARNRALLEAVPDLICRVTRDGIYLDWKASKEDALPVPASEIIGKHLHDCLPTEVAGRIWHHVELALETNEIQIIEYQLWLNGKSRDFEARIVKSGSDEVAVIVQDITERVQARVVLQQVNEALEIRVEERTAALREANHTLRAEIVERQKVEKQLRESEERFRQAVVNAPFPILIHAEDGEILQINQVLTELTGYTHDELPTIAKWTERACGERKEIVRSARTIEDSLTFRYGSSADSLAIATLPRSLVDRLYDRDYRVDKGEFVVTTKYGANRIWDFSSAPLGRLADGRRLIISMATDITERKQVESGIHFLHSVTQALFESQDFHEALGVAIQKVCEATGWDFGEAWVPRVDGSTLECSPAWFSKTGGLEQFRSASETLTFAPGIGLPGRVWLSKQPEWRRDVSAESHEIYLRAQVAREAGLKAGLGIPLIATNGVLAVLVFYMFESQDEDQQLIELISASTELGLMIQRKQTEGKIRKALEKEKELTELKSRFITMTSHEFRTPLTTIQSSSELLEHYSHKWTEKKKLTHLHRIQTSVKHMTKLLNDVLIIGKADAGKLELNPVPLDLENFCRNLVEELQLNDTDEHVITFTCSQGIGERKGLGAGSWGVGEENFLSTSEQLLEDSSSSVPAKLPCMDEKLLRQILENLLSNSIKYSPSGSTVRFTLSYFPNQAVFQIRDQGIGIPTEDQGMLFETFHRATNVGTIAGTGLGLAIVKKCVDIHQGQIAVESEVRVGTTFTVTLPIY